MDEGWVVISSLVHSDLMFDLHNDTRKIKRYFGLNHRLYCEAWKEIKWFRRKLKNLHLKVNSENVDNDSIIIFYIL